MMVIMKKPVHDDEDDDDGGNDDEKYLCIRPLNVNCLSLPGIVIVVTI